MSKNLINLTPHALNIVCPKGDTLTLQPSGEVARVEVQNVELDAFDFSCRVYAQREGKVVDLPPQRLNTGLVVSMMVRKALPDRKDLFSPGDLIRDNDGKPVGCNGLISNLPVVENWL